MSRREEPSADIRRVLDETARRRPPVYRGEGGQVRLVMRGGEVLMTLASARQRLALARENLVAARTSADRWLAPYDVEFWAGTVDGLVAAIRSATGEAPPVAPGSSPGAS